MHESIELTRAGVKVLTKSFSNLRCVQIQTQKEDSENKFVFVSLRFPPISPSQSLVVFRLHGVNKILFFPLIESIISCHRNDDGWQLSAGNVILTSSKQKRNLKNVLSVIFDELQCLLSISTGASLDRRSGKLIESKLKILYEQMPVIYIYAINTTGERKLVTLPDKIWLIIDSFSHTWHMTTQLERIQSSTSVPSTESRNELIWNMLDRSTSKRMSRRDIGPFGESLFFATLNNLLKLFAQFVPLSSMHLFFS